MIRLFLLVTYPSGYLKGVIRTPDQRVRVFVSSTLGELAPERRAVTSAITQMRLTPVLFELGARPYAPRDLYRAYLKQSDVFVGVYGAADRGLARGTGLDDRQGSRRGSGQRATSSQNPGRKQRDGRLERVSNGTEVEVMPESDLKVHEDLRVDTSHGDHERFAHYVDKNEMMESHVFGTPIKALCGKIWVPSRDAKRFPVCPECKEIYESLPDGDDDSAE